MIQSAQTFQLINPRISLMQTKYVVSCCPTQKNSESHVFSEVTEQSNLPCFVVWSGNSLLNITNHSNWDCCCLFTFDLMRSSELVFQTHQDWNSSSLAFITIKSIADRNHAALCSVQGKIKTDEYHGADRKQTKMCLFLSTTGVFPFQK